MGYPSLAFSGIGVKFKREDTPSGGVFTAIAEVSGLSGPNMTRNTIDVTNFDSVDGYMEFIGGLRDGGEVTFDMNFTRTAYDLLKADFESEDKVNYKIDFSDSNDPDSTEFDFAALVTGLGLETPMDDKVSVPVTIKISGTSTVSS